MNLLEYLLKNGQDVIGLDIQGYNENLAIVKRRVSVDQWQRFSLVKGDIRDFFTCVNVCRGVDYVLHHAALVSVIESFDKPEYYHSVNVLGFINMVIAAHKSGVKKFIYASSSAVYGSDSGVNNEESDLPAPLSPYAYNKYHNELYSSMVSGNTDMSLIGLRYFNIYGPGQTSINGYSAVIPKWIGAMIYDEDITIYGDGESCRDFCFVDDVVQANIKACLAGFNGKSRLFNISSGNSYTVNELALLLQEEMRLAGVQYDREPLYSPLPDGEVVLSGGSIDRARSELGFNPEHNLKAGIRKTLYWYIRYHELKSAAETNTTSMESSWA